MRKLTLATRRSALALTQSRTIARALMQAVPGLVVTELELVTSGDKILDKPLQSVGGKGLFVKELEEALLDGRADFAVHSLKDIPAEVAPGLVIAAERLPIHIANRLQVCRRLRSDLDRIH